MMEELTYVNPYTWESEKARASTNVKRRTTKGRNKRRPPGMTPMDRCMNKMRKLRKSWEKERADHEAEFRLSCKLPERDVVLKPFTEQPFGTIYTPDSCGGLCGLSQEVASHLSSSVVAIALFDGDVMLYACTGIALPYRTINIERFLTSPRLVEVFNKSRNKEDNLNIKVRVPSKKTFNGFLELYDEDIAIVTIMQSWMVSPVDLDPQGRGFENTCLPAASKIVAAGRSYGLCGLMATTGTLTSELESIISGCCITEAALGGPLVDLDGHFLGMNICCGSGNMCFMPRHSIFQRVYKFRLLNPDMQGGNYALKECMNGPNPHGAGTSIEETETSSQVYSMPPGAKTIKPSGFLRKLDVLTRLGYPDPPPLMLELNGELINKFEEDFGYLHAWSGYPHNLDFSGVGINPWARFAEKTITTISRRVVSLSSYNEGIRFFACTGLLIKCRTNSEIGTCRRTVILTSASLVRTCDKPDKIDENLRIEVFLPPKQHAVGTLESYDSHHNIAIVSFKGLCAIRPEDIFHHESTELRTEHVVAIGREPDEGLLCASAGKLSKEPITALPCKHLKLSTCKIKKAGIGGPLINFTDGRFIGMNFYDGKSGGTPFLPRSKIVEVLSGMELVLPSLIQKGGDRKAAILDGPTETSKTKRDIHRGGDHPATILDGQAETNNTERWPVPQAYWYSSMLEEDWDKGRKFM